jgi:hypothetical protein
VRRDPQKGGRQGLAGKKRQERSFWRESCAILGIGSIDVKPIELYTYDLFLHKNFTSRHAACISSYTYVCTSHTYVTKVLFLNSLLQSLWSSPRKGSHPSQGSQWRKGPEQMGK